MNGKLAKKIRKETRKRCREELLPANMLLRDLLVVIKNKGKKANWEELEKRTTDELQRQWDLAVSEAPKK